jgi:hypothetical protein
MVCRTLNAVLLMLFNHRPAQDLVHAREACRTRTRLLNSDVAIGEEPETVT